MIVYVRHRIYIDCFCERGLSDTILIVSVHAREMMERGRGTVPRSLSDTILIVSARHRIYIDCFCNCKRDRDRYDAKYQRQQRYRQTTTNATILMTTNLTMSMTTAKTTIYINNYDDANATILMMTDNDDDRR